MGDPLPKEVMEVLQNTYASIKDGHEDLVKQAVSNYNEKLKDGSKSNLKGTILEEIAGKVDKAVLIAQIGSINEALGIVAQNLACDSEYESFKLDDYLTKEKKEEN